MIGPGVAWGQPGEKSDVRKAALLVGSPGGRRHTDFVGRVEKPFAPLGQADQDGDAVFAGE
jgi:hypothetical protein